MSEIVTATGLTPKHPLEDSDSTLGIPNSLLDWSGSENDYASWDSLAIALIGRLERAWVLLKAWPSIEHMPVVDYNNLVERLNDVRTRYFKLRRPWTAGSTEFAQSIGFTWGDSLPGFAWDSSEEVTHLVSIIVDSQCLRQRIDETLAAAGGKPETPGDTGHKPNAEGLGLIGTVGVLALGATVITGATLLARKYGRP